jgi:hypothetical protein
MFGRLTIRFTRTKCYTTFNGETEAGPLRIAAKDTRGVVILTRSSLTGGDSISHIHFEERPNGGMPRYYWISLGQSREYFRRVNRPSARYKSKRRLTRASSPRKR